MEQRLLPQDITQFKKFFPADTTAVIMENLKTLEFKRGEAIYQAAERPQGIYFISSGLVGLVINNSSGKEHLVRLFKSQQFFGHRSLFAEENYHATAIALEPTVIYFVPRPTVMNVCEHHPEMMQSVLRTTAKELRRCEVRCARQLEQDATTRIVETVFYLQKLYPEHNWTRKEIAEFCGSTTPTVIKVLSRLEAKGLVVQNGRKIEIADRVRLEAYLDRRIED